MESSKPKLRALIVDDSPVSAEIASIILEEAGCEARVVDELDSVQRVFDELQPQLILADLRMPPGRSDLAAVLRGGQGAPVWIMSAASESELVEGAARLGAAGWISKNVDPSVLEENLKGAVRKAKSMAASRQLNARFRELSIKKLDALESAWLDETANAADRLEQTRLLVHTLNGDSAMVGFSEFNAVCQTLEESVNAAIAIGGGDLRAVLLAVVRTLRELLEQRRAL